MITTRWLIGVGGWIGLAVLTLAQGPSDPAAMFESARIAAEIEGDAAAAIELYGKVSDDSSATGDLREHAAFEAALLARRLGRDDESRALLVRVADGKSRWARRAQDVLDGRIPQDPRIAARVHRAIEKLYSDGTRAEGSADLQLIGGPAAPYLAEAIRNDKGDLSFTSRAVDVLSAIGGPSTAEFFRSVVESDDVIYRRTVARAVRELQSTSASNAKRDPILVEIRKLLRDEDTQVRGNVMRFLAKGDNVVSFTEGIALLGDPDPGIRTGIAAYPGWLHAIDETDAARAMTAVVESAATLEGRDRLRVLGLICQSAILRTGTGLRMYLDQLEKHEDLRSEQGVLSGWPSSFVSEMPREARPTPSELAARVPRLGAQIERAYESNALRDYRGEGFLRVVFALLQGWDTSDVPGVLELHRALNPYLIDDDFEKHLARILEPEHLPAVLAQFEAFHHTSHIADWLRREIGPKVELAGPLRTWLAKRLDEDPQRNYKWSGMNIIVDLAAAIPDEDLRLQLVALVEKQPGNFQRVASGFIDHRTSGPAAARLIAVDTGAERGSGNRQKRGELLYMLIQEGEPTAAATGAFATAMKRGVEARMTHGAFPEGVYPPFGEWGYDFDTSARILDECLATGEPCAWSFINSRRDISDRWSAVIARRVLDAPEDVLTSAVAQMMPTLATSNDPRLVEIFGKVMGNARDDVRRAAASELSRLLPSPRVNAAIMKALTDPNEDVVDGAAVAAGRLRLEAASAKLTELVRSRPNSPIIAAVAELRGDEAIDVLGPLLQHTSLYVRRNVCVALGRMESRAAAEYLIRALRDSNADVREQAQKSLESLQFFLDQKSRWEKWSKGAGLDQPSAAEALVEQAKPEAEKSVRLAAIESLGTLAQATTLPFLVSLMSDGDADIASAAKAAIDKINGKPGARKD